MAAPTAAASALGSALGQIAAKLLEPIVEPFLEAVGASARLYIMDKLTFTNTILRSTLSVIEGGEADSVYGYTADGLVGVLHGEVWSAVNTMFIHPELADEFVMEMISEGVSNAIQYNLGGAVQSVLNVWRGAYPTEPSDADNYVGNQIDAVDDAMAFIAMAQGGANIPTAALYAVKGANNLLQQNTGALEARLTEHMSRIESLALFFHEAGVEIATRVLVEAVESAAARAEHIANMLRYTYERAAARMQEYLAELLQIKALKDAGVIKPDAASVLGLQALMEARALMEGVRTVEETLVNALDSVTTVDLDTVINEIVALLAEVARVYVNVAKPVPDAVNKLADEAHYKLTSALAMLTMVRTLTGDTYKTTPPVELILQSSEANVPEPETSLPSASASSQESG